MGKDIISVSVKAGKVDAVKVQCDLLAVGVFSDGKTGGKLCGRLDKKLGGAIGKVRELGDFKAKANDTTVLYGDGKIGAKRVLLVGLGDRKKVTADTLRQAAAMAAKEAVGVKAKRAVLMLHQEVKGRKLDGAKVGQAIAEGAYFGSYRYDEYVSDGENGRRKAISVIIGDSDAAMVKALGSGVKTGNIVGGAQSFARTIANRPANVISPPALAAVAKKLARETAGLSCTVFDDKQLKAKKMGGILAVGGGSANKPRLIVLKYAPAGKGSGKVKTIGLVGKAVTFDSGGISIKPAQGMQDMKFDKSGGMAVLGAMKAIAQLKPGVRVYGIIPTAENVPSGTSYRPGDIITTYSGKTVEIQNTDAEGRMILCDAIHYAVTLKCDAIVDVATLTGACVVALGEGMVGLMSNNDGQVKELKAAAEASGEKVWHMPSGEEFLEQMKSKIADLKNIGGKWGGACSAAAFLSEFAGDVNWAHLDIAGAGMFDGSKKKYGTAGSIGFGVRLLTSYVCNAKK